ncbi:MAG TPA: HPr family phosphocarrier protein [Pyrinomonadaceae bacterium]|nr:HPr family phosphocarrier protein [Pyrinomonadaceae bacterium]
MIARKLTVRARLGLHARAAARLVRVASGFQSKVILRRVDVGAGTPRDDFGDGVDAKSILSVLMLAATCGTQLEACAEGLDEEAAITALDELFANAFGETEAGLVK